MVLSDMDEMNHLSIDLHLDLWNIISCCHWWRSSSVRSKFRGLCAGVISGNVGPEQPKPHDPFLARDDGYGNDQRSFDGMHNHRDEHALDVPVQRTCVA
jgi:hypothetical protein